MVSAALEVTLAPNKKVTRPGFFRWMGWGKVDVDVTVGLVEGLSWMFQTKVSLDLEIWRGLGLMNKFKS